MTSEQQRLDAIEQSAWLEHEAETAGYAGLQDLLEDEPALFDDIATQWRSEHPETSYI